MKNIFKILLLLLALPACHTVDEPADNPAGNFEALWRTLDEHYCFFSEKDIDWNEVHDRYAPKISDVMTREELFDVCAAMLDELKDGHTNLVSGFNTSYYRKWWSDYPQNYSARLVEQYYFNFNYLNAAGLQYGYISDNIGYIRYASFSSPVGDGNIENALYYLRTASGLIIDIRDNGGGDLTNVETLVSHFITEPILAGYITHKTGPGHDDFSERYAFYYNPVGEGNVLWTKPVAVLTNRSTFSAANNFASIMSLLPQVSIVGATTGGGSGMPFNSELPCGWNVRFSACPIYDAQGHLTEYGVDPSPGCAVDLDPLQALDGHDTIIDFAINLLNSRQ
ncbi:MAG: S41 family peptidase [Duncaniella sp.]|nr:S41 family peptidase [Duncaniella sp.]